MFCDAWQEEGEAEGPIGFRVKNGLVKNAWSEI